MKLRFTLRFFGTTLALVLLFTLLPGNVSAAETTADTLFFKGNGQLVLGSTPEDAVPYTGVGWSAQGDTLTLHGLSFHAASPEDECLTVHGLSMADGTVLVLEGRNDLSASGAGLCAEGRLTITGTGSLEAKGDAFGIKAQSNLSITGGTILAEAAKAKSTGIFFEGTLTVSGSANVTATGSSAGILGYGNITRTNTDITISGGNISARGSTGPGISGSNVSINGGTVVASSTDSNGICADRFITVSGSAEVIASGGYPALFSTTGISIESGTVDAVSTGRDGILSLGTISIESASVHARGGANRPAIRTKAIQQKDEPATIKITLINLSEKNGGKSVFSAWVARRGKQTSFSTFISKEEETLKLNKKGNPTNALNEIWLTAAPPSASSSGLPTDNWYDGDMAYMVESGIFPVSFAPQAPMTRATFYVLLGRVNGRELGEDTASLEAAAVWAKEQSVSDGTSPLQNVTREQAAAMLYRTAGSPAASGTIPDRFTDSGEISHWARTAVNWCIRQGILQGDNQNRLNPHGDATHAEIAAMFSRYLDE